MELEWIVGKALAKDRERRYQSGVELIVDLERLTTKLRAGGSRVALTPSHGIAEPRRPEGQHATWPVEPASGDPVSVEQAQVLRKRQVRELVLDLGSQGVLPDRLLSQALEVISLRPDESSDESSEAERNRNRLLDDLLDGRVRVGEFIEQWHHSESEKQALAIDSPEKKKAAKKKRKSYGRTIAKRRKAKKRL